MIFRSQRNLRYQKQSEAETQHRDDESTGHKRILQLIYCFSTNSPFFTVRLTIVNGEADSCKPLQTPDIYSIVELKLRGSVEWFTFR
jgi:hypothetical protein